MKKFVIGDEEYSDEVNTTYDQEQPIGDTPSDYPAGGAEPIDAMNAEQFYTIQRGGDKIGEFKDVWKQVYDEVEPNPDFDKHVNIKFLQKVYGMTEEEAEKEFDEGIKETGFESYGMPVDLLTNEELISGRDKLKGGFSNISYLNQIENEIKTRGIEVDWKKLAGDIFSGDIIFNDKEREEIKRMEESLNKDGTGVKHATRGVNPNNPKYDLLKFVYVSKSDCPICKQYDGHTYHKDDPDRPIIPRLESGYSAGVTSTGQSYSGSNYTHPNCKCKWVYVFNKAGESVDPKLMARAKNEYGDGFDQLDILEQKMVVIRMLKKSLSMEKEAEELIELIDPAPIMSMAKLAFDAIKPTIMHRFSAGEAQAFHGQRGEAGEYGIQSMLDDIVGQSLSKGKKKKIEKDISNDFTLDNLLVLTAKALADKLGKKLGVEVKTEEKFKSRDQQQWYYATGQTYWDDEPHENRKVEGEGGKGSGKKGHVPWMLGAEIGETCPNCMIIVEFEDGKCTICGN